MGMEERGVGNVNTLWRELKVRADHFEQIEDLKRAQEHPAFGADFSVGRHVPTWALMSKIVLRLNGDTQWRNTERARRYQAEELGRQGGETFLCDLLPLPAPNIKDWPYPELFPTRAHYEQEILPTRLAMFRTLLGEHRPTHVFCYGKHYWDYYRQLFPKIIEYEPIADGSALLGRRQAGALVVLAPFLASYLLGNLRIEQIAVRLREERFRVDEDDLIIEPAS
jgi:hypothetical protein